MVVIAALAPPMEAVPTASISEGTADRPRSELAVVFGGFAVGLVEHDDDTSDHSGSERCDIRRCGPDLNSGYVAGRVEPTTGGSAVRVACLPALFLQELRIDDLRILTEGFHAGLCPKGVARLNWFDDPLEQVGIGCFEAADDIRDQCFRDFLLLEVQLVREGSVRVEQWARTEDEEREHVFSAVPELDR